MPAHYVSTPSNIRKLPITDVVLYIRMGTHDLRLYVMLMMWTQDLAAILTGPCLPVFHVDAASILAAGMESE